MKPFRIIVILLSFAFLIGCAGSSKKMNLLALGMTKQQVIETIGEPISTSANRNTEYLHYRLTADGFYSDSYYVKLLDGKVESYGGAGSFGLGY
jgi:hypothetical protein